MLLNKKYSNLDFELLNKLVTYVFFLYILFYNIVNASCEKYIFNLTNNSS